MLKYLRNVSVLAAAGAAGIGMAMIAPTVSSAAPASRTATPAKMVGVGSDTIFCVDNALLGHPAGTTGSTVTGVRGGNDFYNIPPIGGVNLGCETTPTADNSVPDSAHSGNFSGHISFANPAVPPTTGAPPGPGNLCANPISGVTSPLEYPDGSGLGVTCYTDDNGNGDIGYTRSSSGPSASTPTTLNYWAFALDAVTWSTDSTVNSGATPVTNLTTADIQNIMNCTYTNWNQIPAPDGPGPNEAINIFYPQTGSGTGAFFAAQFLGGHYPAPSTCLPSSNFIEENTGTQIPAGTTGVFYPYSYALWTAQNGTVEANVRGGLSLEAVNGTQPSHTTIIEAPATFNEVPGQVQCNSPVSGQFCATRYVYHTVSELVSSKVYNAAIGFVGVGGGPAAPGTGAIGAQSLCKDLTADKTTINKYGFKPLTNADTIPGDASSTKSHCRYFAG